MMIWIYTAMYFITLSIMQIVGFYIYAKMYFRISKKGELLKTLFASIADVFLASVLVSPLLFGLGFVDTFEELFNTDMLYMTCFLILCVVSPIPGVIYFKSIYLKRLRELGCVFKWVL
ncbi:hypothetical protein BOW52_08900 [Solemya elarraichensis gill symbiont]|uniref:Uncharacterized protein n=1 Tax=Solemya elarraichensis gill symbiont TaxID=1918949 RepID=A0A1T2KZT0_9GAMM|nr:hypothetical protein BOW52_08900 [Solemya elarraichensis gill symbiont]